MTWTRPLVELLKIDDYTDYLLSNLEQFLFTEGTQWDQVNKLLTCWCVMVMGSTTGTLGGYEQHIETIELYINNNRHIVEVNFLDYQNFEDTLGEDGLQEFLNARKSLWYQRYQANLFKNIMR